MSIDPAASVSPSAKIGKNVAIGPGAVVGPNVTLMDGVTVDPYAQIGASVRKDDPTEITIGERTHIGGGVSILGITRIGADCLIEPECTLGMPPQHRDYNFEPTELHIGDRNRIGTRASISRGTNQGGGRTALANDVTVMGSCRIGHDVTIGEHATIGSGSILAGHVNVHHHATVGLNSTVHQFTRIGEHAMVGAGSLVLRDILPYYKAFGRQGAEHQKLNMPSIMRADISQSDATAIDAVAKELLTNVGPRLTNTRMDALKATHPENPHVQALIDFAATSKRGYAPAAKTSGRDGPG